MPDVWDEAVKVESPREGARIPRERHANLEERECADKRMRSLADKIHLLLCHKDHARRMGPYDERRVCVYTWETWGSALLTADMRRSSYKAAEQMTAIAKKHWLSGDKLMKIIEEVIKIEL